MTISREVHLSNVLDEAAVNEMMNREVSGRSAVFEAKGARQRAAVMVDEETSTAPRKCSGRA